MTVRIEVLGSANEVARDIQQLARFFQTASVPSGEPLGDKPGPESDDEDTSKGPEDVTAGASTSPTIVGAETTEQNVSRPFTKDEVAAAVTALANEPRKARGGRPKKSEEEKAAEAAAKAKARDEKKQGDAEARVEAVTAAEATEAATDPNGESLDALLSQDPQSPIPDAPEKEETTASSLSDGDDLSALLGGSDSAGESPSGGDVKAQRRKELDALSDADLTSHVVKLVTGKGASWFRAILSASKKGSLKDMTRHEMAALLLEHEA